MASTFKSAVILTLFVVSILGTKSLTSNTTEEDRCPLGLYGDLCNITCPINCTADGCQKLNGSCINCREGTFGERCENSCPEHCSFNCTSTGKCEECEDGYRNISADCEDKCSIANCADCILFTDSPYSEYCIRCKEGYYGKFCQYFCAEYCNQDSCKNRLLSHQECACQNGWYGENCSESCPQTCMSCFDGGSCTICHEGFYGDQCDKSCPQKCTTCSKDGSLCEKCENVSDNYGSLCQCSLSQCAQKDFNGKCQLCKSNDWYIDGEGCCHCNEFCKNGCNMTDGTCLGGCLSGAFGNRCQFNGTMHCTMSSAQDRCEGPCEDGWAGEFCNFDCSTLFPNCKSCSIPNTNLSEVTCHECKENYTISHEDDNNSTQYGYCKPCSNCLNDRCNKPSGICLDGCKKGRYSIYETCDYVCPPLCSDGICNKEDGFCTNGCQMGYYGEQCDWKCGFCVNNTCDLHGRCLDGCLHGHYGKGCSSACYKCKDSDCYQNGTCKQGCKQGYFPVWDFNECGLHCPGCPSKCEPGLGCHDNCLPGYYGLYCDKTCPQNCFNCDETTGNCSSCKSGYKGNDCNELCAATEDCQNPFEHGNFSKVCLHGYYGVKCSQSCLRYYFKCKEHSVGFNRCDRYDGHCRYGCLRGTYGPTCEQNCDHCITGCYNNGTCFSSMCRNGYYGDKCDLKCPINCGSYHLTCDQNNGTCRDYCKDGFYGDYCNFTCPDHCYSNSCDRVTGACSQCSIGYGELPNCTDTLSQPYSKRNRGLTAGTISVIVIGSVFGVGLLLFIVFVVFMRFRLKKPETSYVN